MLFHLIFMFFLNHQSKIVGLFTPLYPSSTLIIVPRYVARLKNDSSKPRGTK